MLPDHSVPQAAQAFPAALPPGFRLGDPALLLFGQHCTSYRAVVLHHRDPAAFEHLLPVARELSGPVAWAEQCSTRRSIRRAAPRAAVL